MKNLILIATVLTTCSLQFAWADDDFEKEVVKATPLSQSLYMLEGAGGNITALIGPDGTMLVDDDFAQMAGKLEAKLKELKGDSPCYIVNTHFHYDHTGGNDVFGSTATIIAANKVRERLMTEQTLWNKQHPPVPRRAWPTLTFEKSLRLYLNGEDVQIIHFVHGHTDGDTVVFFPKGKVVSTGDLYFSGMYPIFHPEHNGSLEGYAKNVKRVIDQISDEYKIVSGHGPLSGKSDLEKYHKMILASIVTVRKRVKAGQTLEQIQKAGLAPEWEPFSHGYLTTDRWLALVYKNLKK